MARGRMLNKTVCASKKFNDLPDDTCRLLASWTISNLDKRGVFYGEPSLVKSYVFPRRADVTVEQVAGYLGAMATAGLLVLFDAKGDRWQYWPGFADNQIGLRADRETTTFPCPPDIGGQDDGKMPEGIPQDDGLILREVKVNLSEEKVAPESACADPPALAESIRDTDIPFSEPAEPESNNGPNEPPALKPKKRKSRADPRTQQPAIQAVYHATGRHPPKVLYDKVIASLGDSPDTEKMKECYVAWVGKGFKPTNFAWLFDWYLGTGPPSDVRNRGDPLAEADAAIREYARGGI